MSDIVTLIKTVRNSLNGYFINDICNIIIMDYYLYEYDLSELYHYKESLNLTKNNEYFNINRIYNNNHNVSVNKIKDFGEKITNIYYRITDIYYCEPDKDGEINGNDELIMVLLVKLNNGIYVLLQHDFPIIGHMRFQSRGFMSLYAAKNIYDLLQYLTECDKEKMYFRMIRVS